MNRGTVRRGGFVALLAGCIAIAALASPLRAGAASDFTLHQIGPFGGEPSITSDHNGVLYETTPQGLPGPGPYPNGNATGDPPIYRSLNAGANWTLIQPADNNSGDDCLATNLVNDLYWCNLASLTESSAPLQADVWGSTVPSTCTASCAWFHGDGAIPSKTCGTSCSPFGVDRQWTSTYMTPTQTRSQSEVVLMYHDFYGASQIWVNISHDGGHHFGAPIDIMASAPFSSAGLGNLEAEGFSFCNTVPAGVQIVPHGLPHQGRIYVSWIAADAIQNGQGCNITMLQSFHTAWVGWSDDGGSTWSVQEAWDAGIGHDMSTPFVAFTLDDRGNPYLGVDVQDPSGVLATCDAESLAGTVQTHPECEYNMFVVWSHDGGSTWDGGGGTITGSAAQPYKVNPSTETGTHFFPAIAVGDPGHVDVAYLRTPTIIPTDSTGKAVAGGCGGAGASNPPPLYPQTACSWNLWAGQSTNLTLPPGTATFTTEQLTNQPMHLGDICNLGIFCLYPSSDRSLLDFIQETIDPTTGCAHIGYTDNGPNSPNNNKLMSADQTLNCFGPSTPPPNVPETPWTPLLVPAAVIAGGVTWQLRRRRRTA